MTCVLLILILIITILTGCTTTQSTSTAESVESSTIRLGAILGLSGDIAAYGESQKKGIDLAIKEINAGNYLFKDYELKVIVEDSGDSADGAARAMTKLIQEINIVGIIGPTLSSQAFIADPIAQKVGIPVMGISNTVPGITEMGEFVFRCSLPESSVIASAIEVAAEVLRIKKVGIIWQEDEDYTIAWYQAFIKAIENNGLEVLADETFTRGNTDFKKQLLKIIDAKTDAIVASAFVKEAVQIVIQSRSLEFEGTIIGGNGFNSPEIIQQAGEAAEGVMAGTAWNMASESPKNVEFISAFEKTYGNKPDQFAAQAYTAVWLYANAMRTAVSHDPKAIRDALAGTSNFNSPLGSFSFTNEREPVHPSAIQIIRDGKFVIFNP